MSARTLPFKVDVSPDTELRLARRLEHASGDDAPVVVEIAGNRYRLVPDDVRTTDDPAANYDAAMVRAAIEAGAGAFAGLDVDAFLADVLEARAQDTSDHSF